MFLRLLGPKVEHKRENHTSLWAQLAKMTKPPHDSPDVGFLTLHGDTHKQISHDGPM